MPETPEEERSAVVRPGPSPFAPGSIVGGKYRVEGRIAEGGNGVVVAATHIALKQPVAIKYLKPGPRSDPELVERFEREGRLAAELTSDHVVRVFDVGEARDGAPYMVMERLKGRDLAGIIEESGPLTIPRAVDYVLQACDGLAHAHALKVVHRDIKPDNMFLAERPPHASIVKIIDFGISKAAPERQGDGKWSRRTSENVRFGSPAYMSPEQLRSSGDVDVRTDVWSLGVTLHELLTGNLPFTGDDLPQLCSAIVCSTPPRLTQIRAGAPEQLEAVVLKCLEKDPARRYRNVAELAMALAEFGPPAASDRAKRIKEVLLTSGISVRPIPPPPGVLPATLVSDFARNLPVVEIREHAEARSGQKGRWIAVALAVLAAVAVLATALATRSTVAPAAADNPASGGAAPASRREEPSTTASSIASPEHVSAPSSPVVSQPPAPSAPAMPTSSRRAPSSVQPASGSTVRPAAQAAPVDPRALFGERK